MRGSMLAVVGIVFFACGSLVAEDRKIPVTGLHDADLAPFDELMIKFVADNEIPGAALAVARDGQLVYARGFGHADARAVVPVQPGMRFRIASITKPITAAMILRLIEMGLLKLDDPVFRYLKFTLPATADPRLKKITMRHLLQHTGGFDSNKSFDPMFRPVIIANAQNVPPPAKPLDIIRYMTKQKLDFDPGARYAYSNFGYCLLGRVIEQATGEKYESAVRKHLLEPLGVKHCQLGHTLSTANGEVHYFDPKNRKASSVVGPSFGKPVPLPYGAWYLEAMDAHGGWIASAPALVRFASSFDHPDRCKILKAASIQTMFARPDGLAGRHKNGTPLDVFYGCGWQVRMVGGGRMNTWHTGSLDGTETILVRRSDGLTWAVLFNTRKGLVGKIDPLVHRAADRIRRWPARDLFQKGL